ncbi:AlbA family DNA-binding domain-containing protein [Phyllobacterium calauticae]|uniref:AlbA family DNA-binding domain-containing protein n=1 Tax=Phyllobacterium calauticae TaxID=2817027 RepID=UPI001CC0A24D|nr:ATP-binding protein [Phyllobacterium calauticae]MBZ3693260.1 ATP-binding protein [Phyllobacterium calauticae]
MEIDDILARGEVALHDAIKNRIQESLQLDFKEALGQQPVFDADGIATKHGRGVIAKALSAFSNSAGGILVFGVQCRKDDEKIDCASSLLPFSNYEQAHSDLNSQVGNLLQPKNSGIQVHSFASMDNPSKGYVVVVVPRSDRRPHRSEASGQKGYFKRSGASTFEMEHYDIEDAFRRTASPELELEIRFTSRMLTLGRQIIEMEFWLTNVGDVSAEFPMLHFPELQRIRYDWPAPYQFGNITMENNEKSAKYYSDADFVLHPLDSRKFAYTRFNALIDRYTSKVVSAEPNKGIPFEEELCFELKAKGMRGLSGAFDFTSVEFKDKPWENGTIVKQTRSPN